MKKVLDSTYICTAPGCHTPRLHAERRVPCPNCGRNTEEAEAARRDRIEELVIERESLKDWLTRAGRVLSRRQRQLDRIRPPQILLKLRGEFERKRSTVIELMNQLIVGCQLESGEYNRFKTRLIAEGRLPRTS